MHRLWRRHAVTSGGIEQFLSVGGSSPSGRTFCEADSALFILFAARVAIYVAIHREGDDASVAISPDPIQTVAVALTYRGRENVDVINHHRRAR